MKNLILTFQFLALVIAFLAISTFHIVGLILGSVIAIATITDMVVTFKKSNKQ